MNYSVDRPIESDKGDLLEGASFASHLEKVTCKCNAKDDFVIKIYGEQGSGKTSTINVTIHTVKEVYKEESNRPVIIKFSPWNYSEQSNLISTFLNSLQNQIAIKGDDKFKKKVGKALSDYAGAFDALSIIPILGPGSAALLKTVAIAKGDYLMQEVSLDKARVDLEDYLIKLDRKIIIIIDDIDRPANIQIRDVFQLVKQVADFSNIIYLLTMDRKIVRRTLGEVHNVEGNEYLEKIAQVPFEIPPLQKIQINEILLGKLAGVDDGLVCCNKEIDYFRAMRRDCIEPYINTVRDINRVVNAFRFRYGCLREETNYVDLLIITTLEVMEPELYKWIHNNRETLCSGMACDSREIIKNTTDLEKHYKGEFENISVNPEITIRCLSTLSPAFETALNGECEAAYSIDYIRGKRRIVHYEEFEIYFTFSLSVIKVARAEIDLFMNSLEYPDLWMKVEGIYLRGSIDCSSDGLGPLVDEIPEHRLNLITNVLLGLLNKIGEDSKSTKSVEVYSGKVGSILIKVLNRVDCDENRCNIIVQGVELFDTCGFRALSIVIDETVPVEGEFRDEGRNTNAYENVINRDDLGIIRNKYIQELEGWSDSEEFLKMDMSGQAYCLWGRADYLSVEIHMRKLLRRNVVNSLKLICAIANEQTTTNREGQWSSQENYSDLILSNVIYDYIDKFDKSQMTTFSKTELLELASFYLNYSRDEMYEVDKDEAKELVGEWLSCPQQILIFLKIFVCSL